jgi:nicotinamide-nucleotide amidase
MDIEILNIGDEILIGQVLNTNAQWMAEQLTQTGFNVSRMVTVPDKMPEILEAFAEARKRTDVVLVSGGLGPTNDDLTREALCRFFQCGMKTDQESLARLHVFFSQRGIGLTPLNRLQADVPVKSEAIPNFDGTSPGMWFDIDNKVLVALPGVPFELKSMMEHTVLPRLKERFQPGEVVYRTVLIQGIGESFLSDKIKSWEEELPEGCGLAYLPQPGIVRLRLLMRGTDISAMEATIDKEIHSLQQLIPEYIFGYGEETLAGVVGKLLLTRGESLSTAESCTGGTIAQMITAIPGSSGYFKGSVVAYSNEVKMRQLQVSEETLIEHGAVSEPVVRQMAEQVRLLMQTTYSIAVSGIAGPDGGSEEKPVGTIWIAVAGPQGCIAKKFLLGDHRGRNIIRASLAGLNLLRVAIL